MHADPLDALRFHWGDVYQVEHPAADVWVAIRRDNRFVFRSGDPEGLRALIIADYTANPAPRLRQDHVHGGPGAACDAVAAGAAAAAERAAG